MFDLFDPDQETVIEYGQLPHWYQPGITYFITFRTIDSVPYLLMADWQARRKAWLRDRGYDEATEPEEMRSEDRRLFLRIFSTEFLDYLDRGYGACVLKRPEIAQIVMDSLRHFDGERYDLADAVVMPNHVHALLGMKGTSSPRALCKSWKHFTAVQINKLLGRKDEFWQTESFDHAVRSPVSFAGFGRYIVENPRKASLKKGEYLRHAEGG